MLNFKNLFKNVYGNIYIARKLVMERANQLHKKGINLSNSLKRAWSESRKLAEEFVTKLQKYVLQINKQTFKIEGNDQEEVVEQCLDKIEEVKGRKFAYNVSDNLNARWDRAMETFKMRGTLTFAQDVYIRPMRN